ncbi:MAG TPA: ATP-binding protein [Mycobacteriales bacterium]|nr:ATP-binding protein [Mycobacteriales bacterium]
MALPDPIAEYALHEQPADQRLQELAQLAARVCDVPMAVVNLLDRHHQHTIAAYGLSPSVCARSDSMCAVVLAEQEQVVVPDTRQDLRFVRNPFVTGRLGSVRFYAASPLVGPDRVPFGTLCVLDDKPRPFPAESARWLDMLAHQVVEVLDLRRAERRLRRAVAELDDTRTELARSNEQLAAFAGQVSHDLRGPLTGMIGFVEVLTKLPAVAADEKALQFVELAAASGRRMATLLEDLLAHARVGGALRPVPLELGDLVREAADDLVQDVTESGATLRIEPLPLVTADRSQLRAVLQNLLSNAVRYRRPGSAPTVLVRAVREPGRWRVEVTDDGIGVPVGRGDPFAPLVRLHAEAEAPDAVDGSGLGLATCRRIVEGHGGEIGLAPAAGGGTVAWFTLPDP